MILKLIRPKVKQNFYMLDQYTRFPNNEVRYMIPSLALATLASMTPKGIKVSIIDENIEKIDFDAKSDLVGITITMFTAERGYEIADEFRARGVKVVLGGVQVSLAHETPAKHADSVVIGEAEDVWTKVISDFKKGQLKRVYQSKKTVSLENRPMPRWDLVKNEKYLLAPIMPTRGCSYHCEYCVVGKHFGHTLRKRPVEDVVNEVAYLKDIYSRFWFVDYNLFFDRAYVKELLKALIPFKINYICFANVDIYKDDELLELMAKSGCRNVSLGFETLNPKSLTAVNKGKINRIKEYPAAVKKIQSYGIHVVGLFMMGLEHDTKESFRHVKRFIDENNMIFPDVFLTAAYEGTPFYNRLASKKKMQHAVCAKNCCNVGINSQFSRHDTMFAQMYILKNIYSYSATFRRMRKFTNCLDIDAQPTLKTFLEYKPSLPDTLSRLKMSWWYIKIGNIGQTAFALKLLWLPLIVKTGIPLKGVPWITAFLEWRQSFLASYFISPPGITKKWQFSDKIRFVTNLFSKDYKAKLKKQGVDLQGLISQQEWKRALYPSRIFFNACLGSEIKNKPFFLINMLIVRHEIKKDIRNYHKLQDECYKDIISPKNYARQKLNTQ